MSFEPHGYVSFDTALSAHGVLDHLVHAIRIATIESDRTMIVPSVGLVEWIALPEDALFGDAPGTSFDFPGLRVAEPEKALCDLLWLCESRGFAPPLESLRLDELDRERLARYAARMNVDLSVLDAAGPC
ncbi:MAG: hypothetical protein HYV07_28975 [Deltaproteobacteria bacterium]|nr:hypothetical protein [Deltaproteobacteria bacterium]